MGLFDFFKKDKGKELFEANADAQKRAEAIEAFRARNPRRFTRTPALPKIPKVAWINQPDAEPPNQARSDQEEHAA